MIEAYAFLAVFPVQILAMSVMHPAWFAGFVRAKLEDHYADERFRQMYPGIDRARVDRLLTRYRLLNAGIAVLGLFLLGGLVNYLQRPDWTDGPVEALVAGYFILQVSPLLLAAAIGIRLNQQAFKRSPPQLKRKASLQRRGLFDFVSPFTVFLAVLGYLLFAAFMICIEQAPFPSFAGAPINIGLVTLAYALQAAVVYVRLYGRKSSPLETHEDRMRSTAVIVKACVYSCIACVAFLSINFTLVLLDMQRWEPFAQSVCLVICAVLCSMGLTAPPRRPEADGLGAAS